MIVGGGILAYAVRTKEKDHAALIGVSVACLCLVIALSICVWYYVKRICDPEPYKITKLEGALFVEAVGDHHHYKNEREQTVKALRNNVRLIEVRSHWTGSYSKQTYKVSSTKREHKLFDGYIREEDARIHRWIYLSRALGKKDESVTVGVCQEWEDDLEAMHPYYREGGARYKTRDLKITARFRAKDAPRESDVEGCVWNTAKSEVTGQIKVQHHYDPQSQCMEYFVIVPKPKRFHSYGVRWSWPDQSHKTGQ